MAGQELEATSRGWGGGGTPQHFTAVECGSGQQRHGRDAGWALTHVRVFATVLLVRRYDPNVLRIYILSKYKGSQDILARLFNVAQRLQVRQLRGGAGRGGSRTGIDREATEGGRRGGMRS